MTEKTFFDIYFVLSSCGLTLLWKTVATSLFFPIVAVRCLISNNSKSLDQIDTSCSDVSVSMATNTLNKRLLFIVMGECEENGEG